MIMAHDQPDMTASTNPDAGRQQPRIWGPGTTGGQTNVGERERWISSIGGGALALYGLKRGGLGGAVLLALGGGLIYRGYSGHCSAYESLGINTATDAPAPPEAYFERGIHVNESVTIDKRPWDLYAFWKDFENLPRFLDHLESVRKIDDRRSHWVAKAPAGTSVEWDAEIINDEPNALLAWRSLGGASVDNAGSVRFIPGNEGEGTQVRVVLDYIPPAGRLGAAVARLFGEEPSRQVREDLRRFKELMEGA